MTIRQDAEAILAQHWRDTQDGCDCCGEAYPCNEAEHAQAIIDALDEAPAYNDIVFYGDGAEFLGNKPIRARMVPDPREFV